MFTQLSFLLLAAPLAAQVASNAACRPFFSNTVYLHDQNSSIQTGDFNSDGIPDLVALSSQGLNVLLGRGDGTFRAAGIFPAGTVSGAVAVGDFNHDGKLDVAAVNASGTVYVLLGNGDGTFQAPKGSPIYSQTSFLAVGDFNHDGKLDLAGVSYEQFPYVVQVLLGNGDGTFQAPVNYSLGSQPSARPSAIAIADFNHDGHLDLAVTNYGILSDPGHTVSVLLGNGDGTFRRKVEYQVGMQPDGITAADLNGDGKADLATSNYTDGTVSVLLGNGDGTFQAAATYAAGHPDAPHGIAAVRFDRGGRPGLAVASLAGTFILVNKGDGTFQPAQGYGPGSYQVVPGDFNGDGVADLALAAIEDDEGVNVISVAVLLGSGHGVFPTSTAYAQGLGPYLYAMAVGDFNSDGIPDLVLTDPPSNLIAVVLGEGKGRFSGNVKLLAVQDPGAIAAGDLNGDGMLDLAIVSEDHVQIMLGSGDGNFRFGGEVQVLEGLGGLCCIALGDFNGDGILDMAVVSSGGSPYNAEVSVLLGNGNGTFKKAVGYGAGAYYLLGLAVADFNHDGKLDLAVSQVSRQLTNPTLKTFLGNGDGTFQHALKSPLEAEAFNFAPADFNGDGVLDLAVPLSNKNEIEILLGNGNGTFRPGAIVATRPAIPFGSVAAADLNGDGKVDLAFSAPDSLFLQVFPGKGDGTFGPSTNTFAGLGPGAPAVADLNGDGALDVVLTNYAGGSVSVFLNRCVAK